MYFTYALNVYALRMVIYTYIHIHIHTYLYLKIGPYVHPHKVYVSQLMLRASAKTTAVDTQPPPPPLHHNHPTTTTSHCHPKNTRTSSLLHVNAIVVDVVARPPFTPSSTSRTQRMAHTRLHIIHTHTTIQQYTRAHSTSCTRLLIDERT